MHSKIYSQMVLPSSRSSLGLMRLFPALPAPGISPTVRQLPATWFVPSRNPELWKPVPNRKSISRKPLKEPISCQQKPLQIRSKSSKLALARAVDVYRSAGREITGDLLARFRLMAARCDPAARTAGASGGDWLADALTTALGVARPGNLLNYADAVLNDWIANGRNEKPLKPAARSRSNSRQDSWRSREPGVNQGIIDYLEKHGGMPHGDPD